MRSFITALVFAVGTVASAETLPAFYSVTGVGSHSSLNVRVAPSGGAEVIGSLAPDQTGIEITAISPNGYWARLNTRETRGWAATRYLALEADYPFLPTASLACFGTEPFWSLELPSDMGPIAYNDAGGASQTWQRIGQQQSTNRTDRFSVIGENTDETVVVTLTRETCSDGMSDRAYGISTEFIRLTAEPSQLSGCCTLQP